MSPTTWGTQAVDTNLGVGQNASMTPVHRP